MKTMYYANTQVVHDELETTLDVQVTADDAETLEKRQRQIGTMLDEQGFRLVTDYGWDVGVF